MNSRSYVIFLTWYRRTLSAVRSAGQRARQGGTDRRDRGAGTVYAGRDRGRKISKNRVAARRKKSFLRAFSDFFKKLFHVQNLCFRLFSPVLRTTTRACVFIIFEKNSPKNIFKKPIDSRVHDCYNGHCQQDRGTAPGQVTGTASTV